MSIPGKYPDTRTHRLLLAGLVNSIVGSLEVGYFISVKYGCVCIIVHGYTVWCV